MIIETDALILIAEDQKFFEAKGLGVTIRKYDTGLAATNAMIKGEVDIWIATHPDVVKRFLKALVQAEGYLIRNPAEAKAITQKEVGYDDEFMAVVWSESQPSLSIDQPFIIAMEDEARWMIRNNLTTEREVPNFGEYIQEDFLKAIKSEAVSIIR